MTTYYKRTIRGNIEVALDGGETVATFKDNAAGQRSFVIFCNGFMTGDSLFNEDTKQYDIGTIDQLMPVMVVFIG